MKPRPWAAAILVLPLAASEASPVVITEFMASNTRTLPKDDAQAQLVSRTYAERRAEREARAHSSAR